MYFFSRVPFLMKGHSFLLITQGNVNIQNVVLIMDQTFKLLVI